MAPIKDNVSSSEHFAINVHKGREKVIGMNNPP
jgi:hypothetical protein